MPAKNLQRVAEGGTYCHVYNRGVESRNIFADDVDYQVFLGFLEDYLSAPGALDAKKKDFTINGRVFRGIPHQPKNYFDKVELATYSLQPDHFHLVLHQKTQKSLQAFIRSLCTRYSMYFNKKYNRTGSLFDGPYKSVVVKNDSSLLLLTRYLHKAGGYSTYAEYSGQKETPWVRTKVILSAKFGSGNYKDYVEKYEPNQTELEVLGEIVIEQVDRHLERRDPEAVNLKLWARIPELLAAGTVFVILLGFGFRNVTAVAKKPEVAPVTLGTNTASAIPAPTPSPEPKIVLIVRYTEGPVNIREQPTVQSKKIGEAADGDKFEFVWGNSGWYQVNLPDGLVGFIKSQYIEKQEEVNND